MSGSWDERTVRAQKHKVAQLSASLYRPVIIHATQQLSVPGPKGEAPSHRQSVVPQHDAFTKTHILYGKSKDVEDVEDGENGEDGDGWRLEPDLLTYLQDLSAVALRPRAGTGERQWPGRVQDAGNCGALHCRQRTQGMPRFSFSCAMQQSQGGVWLFDRFQKP